MTDGTDTQPPLPEPIFSQVVRLLDAADAAFAPGVERLCQQHPELAERIRAEAAALRQRAVDDVETELRPGERVGPYVVLEVIGAGGMGAVYLAEQREPLRRRVALKVIKLGMDTKAVLARFEAERQALALMDHPHIAKVLEAGATPQGRPYFAMEYVRGVPITRYCDDHLLSLDDRLHLFRQVCSGVQHAHTKGVIHRDLTPSNVLVGLQDGRPVAKIIDFGLARATDRSLTERTLFTQHGVILGTPAYMSPEQAGLDALDVDMRSDVYTLGVLLYELLTGKLPFDPIELRRAGYDLMCRTIRESDPPRPSTRVTTAEGGTAAAAKRRRTDPSTLLRRLRGDLDWIVLKCLEKDRTRRYETVSELAADVQRHLDHEPVQARAPSLGYRLGKLGRRYRAQLAAAAMVLLALVAGLIAATWFWLDARAQAREARRQATIAHRESAAKEAAAAAAERSAALHAAKVREFDQLAAVVRYERAVAAESELYPPWPEKIAAMEQWLRDTDALLAMRPELAATVAEVDARTTAGGDSAESARFLRDRLAALLDDLAALAAQPRQQVERRLRWARQIAALTRAHPRARVTWQAAREAVARADGVGASPLYRGRDITLADDAVLGLVPIGMNPKTGLWEFYDLRSAWDGDSDPAAIEIPTHVTAGDRAGHIEVGETTGIVFVLLPGGTFRMGAQADDPAAPNHDPKASGFEMPVHEVELAPFFIARHELTRSQWLRLTFTTEDPSSYRAGTRSTMAGTATITLCHPLEYVAPGALLAVARRNGMTLPTEAQWEYACRGGTDTVWYTGDTAASLQGHDNLADATAADSGAFRLHSLELRDGYVLHAPVGSFAANPFGLHDVHGNVQEWCLDPLAPYSTPAAAGDGRREGKVGWHVYRGGGFDDTADGARAAVRYRGSSDYVSAAIGCRLCRPLR